MPLAASIDALNILVAVAHFGVALFVLVQARRLAGHIPAAVGALSAFFLLAGAARLNDPDPFLGYRPQLVTVFDALSLAVLVALLFYTPKLARAAVQTVDEASLQAREYERARRDYTQLVRHRVFNPLTVVRGAAATLRENRRLSAAERETLLDAIVRAAATLEQMTLDPVPRGAEERSLQPRPQLPHSGPSHVGRS